MRLKIIFMPLAILIAIVVAIWYIWPLIGEIQTRKSEVEASKVNLASTLNKKENLEKLKVDLDNNKDKEDFILSYLPSSGSDEKIIDGINYLATDSGSTLTNLNISKEKTEVAPAAQPQETVPGTNPTIINNPPNSSPDASQTLVAPRAKPKANFTNVKVTVYGKYDNIKMFLSQIYKMEMFNTINSLSISKAQADTSGGETVSSDLLAADIEIKFGYLLPVHGNGSDPAPIFLKSNFDYSPYTKIINAIARKIPALDEGQKGKSNPFLP